MTLGGKLDAPIFKIHKHVVHQVSLFDLCEILSVLSRKHDLQHLHSICVRDIFHNLILIHNFIYLFILVLQMDVQFDATPSSTPRVSDTVMHVDP